MINIGFKITGDMDIDSSEIEIKCPKCQFYNMIWIKQARLRDVIICRGCKSNIYLDDGMNTVCKARRRLLEQFKKIKHQIDQINRLSW